MKTSRSQLFVFALAGVMSSCDATYDIGKLDQPIGCTSDSECADDSACDLAARACKPRPDSHKIDVLFLIDNSTSTSSQQAALARNIPHFLKRLDDAGADYHIGFASSDIGTMASPGTRWVDGSIGCNTFAGDDGLLQATPCTDRTFLQGPDAINMCKSLCPDSRFVPTDGKPYLSKTRGITNVPTDWALDSDTGRMMDRGPQRAFSCMALLGDAGCTVEGHFEAAKRALDGHRTENAGFLRNDSTLAIIFLTDEDDCSVKLAARNENDPSSHDCSTPDANAAFGCFNVDYRCMARNVECDQPMNVAGKKTNCHERETSYLESESTYVSFFAGLRPANHLFVGGIYTLAPIDDGGSLNVSYQIDPKSDALNRVSSTCAKTEDGSVIGMPQLRLSKLVRSFRTHQEADLCQPDKYAASLDDMAKSIVHQAGL